MAPKVSINATHAMVLNGGDEQGLAFIFDGHSWIPMAPKPTPVSNAHAGLVVKSTGKKLIVAAGGTDPHYTEQAIVEIFDLDSQTWRPGK